MGNRSDQPGRVSVIRGETRGMNRKPGERQEGESQEEMNSSPTPEARRLES
jgi:hypothetical protein